MPLYEYLCEACGRRTELLQRYDDAPLTNCPQCGGAVKKQFSAPAFHLKGSGWYATDYAKKGAAGDSSKSESSKSENSKSESSSASTSDSSSSSASSEAKAGTDKPSPAAPSSSGGSSESKS